MAYFLQIRYSHGKCHFLKSSPFSGTLIKKSESIIEQVPVIFSSSKHAYDLHFSGSPDSNILCSNQDGNFNLSEEGVVISFDQIQHKIDTLSYIRNSNMNHRQSINKQP